MRLCFRREARSFDRNSATLWMNLHSNFLGSWDDNLSCSFIECWAHWDVANSSCCRFRSIIKGANSCLCSVNKIVENHNVSRCHFLFQTTCSGGCNDVSAVKNLQGVDICSIINIWWWQRMRFSVACEQNLKLNKISRCVTREVNCSLLTTYTFNTWDCALNNFCNSVRCWNNVFLTIFDNIRIVKTCSSNNSDSYFRHAAEIRLIQLT